MQYKDNKNIKKIPVLTEDELKELGKVLHLHKNDNIMKIRFWKQIYNKRGLDISKIGGNILNRQMKLINGSTTAAIYARKSKATDKGESVESQISRCITLYKLREWGYIVFQDYDFSGKDIDSPDFTEMMKQIHKGKLQYLVCYKLDRISRSTGDLSNLIKELDLIDVAFISIKENFHLSTPMGRAMMMVTSVFAQLDRETIAERVRN